MALLKFDPYVRDADDHCIVRYKTPEEMEKYLSDIYKPFICKYCGEPSRTNMDHPSK